MHTYTHKSKTTGRIRMCYISNDCFFWRKFIFWVRSACEIQLVSYASKHTLQSLSDMLFVCAYTLIWKLYRSYMDVLRIEELLYHWRHSLCSLEFFLQDPTGELQPQTCVCRRSLIQHHHAYTVSLYIHCCLVHNYPWQQNSHSLWLYYAPNDGFILNNALFVRTNLASYVLYTLCCVFSITAMQQI